MLIRFCNFFVLLDLIVDSELPDADVEGGSDGEEEFGASILMCFLWTIIPENYTYVFDFLLCIIYLR